MFAAIGPGTVQGDEGGDVLELGGGEGSDQGAHGTPLELEDPDRVGPLEHVEHCRVVEGNVVDVGPLARSPLR